MNRTDVLSQAVDQCIKEIYSYAQPKVEWNKFLEENKDYSKKYKEWEQSSDENKPSLKELGPRPYEFYYIPKEIIKDICDSYVYAYRIDQQQELLDTIETLKNYCKEPIVDKYIEGKNGYPGYRGYDHPDNLEKELRKIIKSAENIPLDKKESYEKYYNKLIEDVHNKFFEFLDMAGNFYNWNRDLNNFNVSVYLGPSPNSNKKAVIDNWKKYRNKYIVIDEEQIKKEYYGEDYND